MDPPQANLVLWIGPKHSGKSTAVGRLVDRVVAEGFSVAGILAPAIYRDGVLAGFDVVNVATGLRMPLARRTPKPSGDTGRFAFCPGGLRFGNAALGSTQTRSAALVIVDEFGPLELRGKGWRGAVDRLVSGFPGTLLVVVREELAGEVAGIYAKRGPRRISATQPGAVDLLLPMLLSRSPSPD
jgi:nucleoside-triphosphatase THEP1